MMVQKQEEFITDAAFGDLEDIKAKYLSVNINGQRCAGDADTALIAASKQGHLSVVTFLVEHGAIVDLRNIRNETPLLKAARGGHLDCVKYLIEQGAEVNIEDIDGRSPLMWACHENQYEVVSYLIDKNADLAKEDKNRFEPLTFAAWNGHVAIAKLLLDSGAPFSSNFAENGALYNAISRNIDQVVKIFLEKGIDLGSINSYGDTPLSMAINSKSYRVENLIRAYSEQHDLNKQISSKMGPDTGINF